MLFYQLFHLLAHCPRHRLAVAALQTIIRADVLYPWFWNCFGWFQKIVNNSCSLLVCNHQPLKILKCHAGQKALLRVCNHQHSPTTIGMSITSRNPSIIFIRYHKQPPLDVTCGAPLDPTAKWTKHLLIFMAKKGTSIPLWFFSQFFIKSCSATLITFDLCIVYATGAGW